MRPGLSGARILELALEYGIPRKVSDLQIRTDRPLYIHTSKGVVCITDFGVLSHKQVLQIFEELLRKRNDNEFDFVTGEKLRMDEARFAQQMKLFGETKVADFASDGPKLACLGFTTCRMRVQAHLSSSGLGITVRVLNDKIPELEVLGHSPDIIQSVRNFSLKRAGLALVTGPTGSGKSTTLAALIDWVRRNAPKHIVTIEDPIEYQYPDDMADPNNPDARGFPPSVITQQEVGRDVRSYRQGLKDVLRKAPHIILIGEIRDRETMETCLEAAQTGHFVLSTLHTTGAVRTISRILEFYPKEAHGSILKRLSETLLFVLSQGLLIGVKDRVLNFEFFQNTDDAVASAIANYDGGAKGLDDVIRRAGNVEWDANLTQLFNKGLISREMFESVRFRKDEAYEF